MNAFGSIALIFCSLIIFSGNVHCGPHADGIQKAFDNLSPKEQQLFLTKFGPLMQNSILDVVKCIENKAGPLDACNFKTSIDPFYYIKQCANGTLVDKLIEDTLGKIPGVTLPVGIPPTVSKERCFSPSLPDPLPIGGLPNSGKLM